MDSSLERFISNAFGAGTIMKLREGPCFSTKWPSYHSLVCDNLLILQNSMVISDLI